MEFTRNTNNVCAIYRVYVQRGAYPKTKNKQRNSAAKTKLSPTPGCRHNWVHLNIYLEHQIKQWLTYFIQQNQESVLNILISLFNWFIEPLSFKVFRWEQKDVCYINNRLESSKYRDNASIRRLIGLTGVQCCHRTQKNEISLRH